MEFFRGLAAKIGKKPAGSGKPSGRDSGGHGSGGPIAGLFRWNDEQWKKVQKICLAVIIFLVVLIIILWAASRSHKKDEPPAEPVIPETTVVEQPTPPPPTPTPEPYPNPEIRAAIAGANLDTFPGDMDYVTEPTTATVTVSSELNLRRSNSSGGGWIASIPSGTVVDVYAYKSGSDGNWALVNYNGTWGWCSANYLK